MQIISKAKNNLGMVSTTVNPFKVDIKVEPTDLLGEYDEINQEIMEGINAERRGTKYKPIGKGFVEIRFNAHPSTKGHKDLSQRRYILAKCKEWGYGKAFYYLTKIEKV